MTIVKLPLEHCYQHDPARSEERRRNASRAGKSTGSREIRDLKQRISDVIDAVLGGSVDRGRAAVAVQGLSALRSVLELERKIKETDALEARLEELEAILEHRKGEHRGHG
jgi:hypothetical protein